MNNAITTGNYIVGIAPTIPTCVETSFKPDTYRLFALSWGVLCPLLAQMPINYSDAKNLSTCITILLDPFGNT